MHKEQIIHRDIKPQNIFMTLQSLDGICLIGDYGTCRQLSKSGELEIDKYDTLNSTVAGSGFYMAPEVK